jgi:hypothetical protein
MIDLEIKALVGRLVLGAQINDEKDLVALYTDKGMLYLTWEGDCCAHCFLAAVTGAANLIGATIMEVTNSEWIEMSNDDNGVIESVGTTIQTSSGTVTFESRVEHNGFYGGYIQVSDGEPKRYKKGKFPTLLNLTDFSD